MRILSTKLPLFVESVIKTSFKMTQ